LHANWYDTDADEYDELTHNFMKPFTEDMIAKLSEMAAPPTATLEVVSPIVTHEPEMQDAASE
jgi:hypothetical protein